MRLEVDGIGVQVVNRIQSICKKNRDDLKEGRKQYCTEVVSRSESISQSVSSGEKSGAVAVAVAVGVEEDDHW